MLFMTDRVHGSWPTCGSGVPGWAMKNCGDDVEATSMQLGRGHHEPWICTSTHECWRSDTRPHQRRSAPNQVTLITVHTKDGQESVWEVEQNGVRWDGELL